MKRRQWDAKASARIVLEGLQGKPVAELCNEYQIGHSQSYQWRDQLLANASKAFEAPQDAQKDARLARENARLKALVGEFNLALKKATSGWDEAALVALGRPA